MLPATSSCKVIRETTRDSLAANGYSVSFAGSPALVVNGAKRFSVPAESSDTEAVVDKSALGPLDTVSIRQVPIHKRIHKPGGKKKYRVVKTEKYFPAGHDRAYWLGRKELGLYGRKLTVTTDMYRNALEKALTDVAQPLYVNKAAMREDVKSADDALASMQPDGRADRADKLAGNSRDSQNGTPQEKSAIQQEQVVAGAQAWVKVNDFVKHAASMLNKAFEKKMLDVRQGPADFASELKQAGIKVTSAELYKAIEENNIDRVRQLINAGVKIKTPKDMMPPLLLAVKKKNIELAGLLINKLDKKQIHATMLNDYGQEHRLTYPKGGGTEVKTVVYMGETSALTKACSTGQLDMVKLLVANGADVNKFVRSYSCDNDQDTPLMRATRKGHSKVIRELLDAGADINARTKIEGETALHLAGKYKQKKCLQTLIECGADLDVTLRSSGYTAMHLACDEISFIKILAQAGARLDRVKNFEGKTADTPLNLLKEGYLQSLDELTADDSDKPMMDMVECMIALREAEEINRLAAKMSALHTQDDLRSTLCTYRLAEELEDTPDFLKEKLRKFEYDLSGDN